MDSLLTLNGNKLNLFCFHILLAENRYLDMDNEDLNWNLQIPYKLDETNCIRRVQIYLNLPLATQIPVQPQFFPFRLNIQLREWSKLPATEPH